MTTPIGRGMRTVVAAVRSALFMVVFYLGSVPLVAAAAVAGLISTPAVIDASHRWAGWFAWTARVILGIQYRIVGTVPDHAALVALKHQSAYETIMILWLFRRPATVLKAELLGIPLWGAAARAHGVIPVDRAGSAAALRAMLKAGNAAKAAGRPIVIFPEGTRTAVGAAPPLKAGLAGLYRALRLPLIPVALDAGVCWPRGFVKYSGTITFHFQDAIPAGLERDDLEARVRTAINALNPA